MNQFGPSLQIAAITKQRKHYIQDYNHPHPSPPILFFIQHQVNLYLIDSLSDLLAKEGFIHKRVKFNKTRVTDDSIALPIYICHNHRRKSIDVPNHNKKTKKSSSSSCSSLSRRSDEPAIDEVATKAVISILSGYGGRYLKDKRFRDSLRDTCCMFSDNVAFGNLELGIESIEKLIQNHGTVKEMKVKLLRNSIGFLTIFACLNSKESRDGGGNPNSQLSACAQLYLSIVYKIEKNDRICARHVLQTESVLDNLSRDQEQQMEHLSKVYEDHMNTGTVQFALYYKEWLKTGGQPPANLPFVPLPSVNLLSSSSTHRLRSSTFNNFLHCTIFGNDVEKQPSMEFDYEDITQKQEQEEELYLDDYNTNQQINIQSRLTVLPSQSFKTQTNVTNSNVNSSSSSSDLTQAISTISSSQSLTECELAIRVMAKAWLDDPLIEKTLSKQLIIEGMLEVLFSSNNEEILELVISLLTKFVTRNESNCKIITNFDPQLEGFMNLMRNSSLFLKAASLLFLVKPEAKQMVSTEWIPLVLRVLEFGDQTQTLFSARCSPQVAAYYFLDQLLNGFDQDRNKENGRQVISLGGLSLLLRRMASGDIVEKMKGISIIYRCVQSDGRCRHYLADNLNPELILEVMVHAKELDCSETTISLLIELVCLHRFEQRTKLFDNLLKGWDCLSTMQILLVCLERATRETRPLVAAIMFQLDLMGDPLESSVYCEEAIGAIIESLDREIFNERVQEQAAKSLLILGSRYSYTGTPEAEKWILKEAGYDMSLEGGFHGRYYVVQGSKTSNNEDEIEHWQRKAAMSLWMSGGKKLIGALGESIANGLPCLVRASLVTVAWISKFVHTVGDGDVLHSIEFSTLVQHLIQCLNRDNTIEERVLASFSLLSFTKSSGFRLEISDYEKKEMVIHLRSMSKVTWSAKRLGSIITDQEDIQGFN